MRRIPTAKQKEELKCLLKKQYEDVVDSIDRDVGLHPALEDWRLVDEIEKTRKRIYEVRISYEALQDIPILSVYFVRTHGSSSV